MKVKEHIRVVAGQMFEDVTVNDEVVGFVGDLVEVAAKV